MITDTKERLVLSDIEGWAMTFSSTAELVDYVEWQEVHEDELRVCSDAGCIYEFEILPNKQFKLIKTDKCDKQLPKKYLYEYAAVMKICDSLVDELLAGSKSVFELFDYLEGHGRELVKKSKEMKKIK